LFLTHNHPLFYTFSIGFESTAMFETSFSSCQELILRFVFDIHEY